MKKLLLSLTVAIALGGCSRQEDDPLKFESVDEVPAEPELQALATFEQFPAFHSRVDQLTEQQSKILGQAMNLIQAHGGYANDNPSIDSQGHVKLGGPNYYSYAMLFYQHHRFDGGYFVPAGIEWDDSDLAVIRVLPNLTDLNILNGPFTDEALIHLQGRTDIKKLDLSMKDPVVCHEGHHLSGKCRCGGEPYHGPHGFTAKALTHLAGLTELRHLNVASIPLTDDSLRPLASLTKLETLDLSSTGISDAGLEHLSGLHNLQDLYFVGAEVTGPGLQHLKGMTRLEILDLSDTQVTDDGLIYLKGLTSLKRIDLDNTQVTLVGVDRLRQAIPGCVIHYTRE